MALADINSCKMEDISDFSDNLTEYSENITFVNVTEVSRSKDWYGLTLKLRKGYFYLLCFIAQMLIICLSMRLCKKFYQLGLEKTAKHAFYCTLTYIFILGECILIRNEYDFLPGIFNKQQRNSIHLALGLTSFFVGAVGVADKYLQKRSRSQETGRKILHFRTKHGFYGILGPVLLLICVILGFITFFTRSEAIKGVHRALGCFTYFIMIIAQFLGYSTGFMRRNFSKSQIQLYKFFTIVLLMTTLHFSFRRIINDVSFMLPDSFFTHMNFKREEAEIVEEGLL